MFSVQAVQLRGRNRNLKEDKQDGLASGGASLTGEEPSMARSEEEPWNEEPSRRAGSGEP